jgi:hypothetical protein
MSSGRPTNPAPSPKFINVDKVLTLAGLPQFLGEYLMIWQIQLILAWLQLPHVTNLIFAVLCFASACGVDPRWCAICGGVIYLLLVL